MSIFAICGHCCERVPCEDSGITKWHNCEVLQSLKRKMDDSLRAIQEDFKNEMDKYKLYYNDHISDLNKRLAQLDICREGLQMQVDQFIHKMKWQDGSDQSCFQQLFKRVDDLEKQLSTCIDVKLLYSDRQARETWQTGCEVMIETLHKKIVDLEYMFKQTYVCVDNSHADENAKRFGLAPVSQLNKMAMGELKVLHPSRKHLEGELREKNELTKQMQENINELEEKLQRSYQDYHELSQKNKLLIESCAKRDNEIDKLKYRLKFCCCPNQIRTWAGMKDEPK